MAYLEFQAAIYDGTQSNTVPTDLTTLTPGGGGFTPGGRDTLKNLAGFLVASGGWTLASVAGTDPATYTFTSTGVSGFDSMALELSWDSNRANLQVRMGTGFSAGSIQNPSSFQTWPVTNGASSAVNSPRVLNVHAWADKDSVNFVTKESTTANYSTGIGPMGLLKRWTGTTPTGLAQAGKDYTAIFMTLPTRILYLETGTIPVTAATLATSNQLSEYPYGTYTCGPTAQYSGRPAGSSSSQVKMNYSPVLNAIRVYQNFGSAAASWIVNHLNAGIMFDTDSTQNESGSTYNNNMRHPTSLQPTLGTDGLYHLDRERVFQRLTNSDADPRLRGLLPGVVYAGPNAGGEFTELVAGSETYKRINVNLGFWPRMNPLGYAIRKV